MDESMTQSELEDLKRLVAENQLLKVLDLITPAPFVMKLLREQMQEQNVNRLLLGKMWEDEWRISLKRRRAERCFLHPHNHHVYPHLLLMY